MFLIVLQEKISNTFEISSFVQKPFLGTNYNARKKEEDIDMKNQHEIKNFQHLVHPQQAASKFYVDIKFNGPSII